MTTLPPQLTEKINARYNLDTPEPNLYTFQQISQQTHQLLGYDATAKQLWALTGTHGEPPGTNPTQYWETYLAHGASGTCFATAIALDAYLKTLGYNAAINTWKMLGRPTTTKYGHATNTVTIDNTRYMIEASSNIPDAIRWAEPSEATSSKNGYLTMTNTHGRTRLHLPRAIGDGTKIYELVDETATVADLTDTYRTMLETNPEEQKHFVWAKTTATGNTISIHKNNYLLRKGYEVLEKTVIDKQTIKNTLKEHGYSNHWIETLDQHDAYNQTES